MNSCSRASRMLLLPFLLLFGQRALSERVVTDAAGRKVTVPEKVSRVFAAGPPASILLFSLAPGHLAGWTRPLTSEEKEFLPPEAAALPVLGRLTGKGGTANLETLLASRIDLIVDYGDTSRVYAELADRIQAQTGIPYLLLDGRLRSTPAAYRILGKALGLTERGEDLATYCQDLLDSVERRSARLSGVRRPRVYFGRGPRGLETAVPGTVTTEAFELLRIENVAGSLSAGKLVTVSLEQILAWNPDWVLTTDPSFMSSLASDPLWKSLSAVRGGNVRLSPLHPFPWLDSPPSVNRLAGLVWLGKLFYPADFPEDLTALTASFYERVYHRKPTPAQIARLLAAPSPPKP